MCIDKSDCSEINTGKLYIDKPSYIPKQMFNYGYGTGTGYGHSGFGGYVGGIKIW